MSFFGQKALQYRYKKDTIEAYNQIQYFKKQGFRPPPDLLARIYTPSPMEINLSLIETQDGFYQVDTSHTDSLFIRLFQDKQISIKDSAIIYQLIPQDTLTKPEQLRFKERNIQFYTAYTYLDVRPQHTIDIRDIYYVKDHNNGNNINHLYYLPYHSIYFRGLVENSYNYEVSNSYEAGSIMITFVPHIGITSLSIKFGAIYKLHKD